MSGSQKVRTLDPTRCPMRRFTDAVFHPTIDEFQQRLQELESEEFCKWAVEHKLCSCYMLRFFKYQDECTKKYIYLVTFTVKDVASIGEAEIYVRDRINLGYVEMVKYSIEHKDTNPHIHAIIYSRSPLQKSIHFKHYMNRFGFVDFKSVNPKTVQQVVDYITKEGSVTTLVKP